MRTILFHFAFLVVLFSAVSTLSSCGRTVVTGAPSEGLGGSSPTTLKGTPVIHWPPPAAITNPAPLSGAQLNAVTGIPGTFVYTPPIGTVLAAGTQTLSVTFTPTDTTDYTTATASVTLTVNLASIVKTTPTITWAAPAAITNPTPLSASQLNATASVTGTFVYSPAAGIVLAAGTQMLSVTFTPVDTTDYTTATAAVPLTVNPPAPIKTTPAITWAQPAAITNPTPLSADQLDATAGVPGTFVYMPSAGTVLAAGTQTLSAMFSPTDTTDYNSTTASVTITVNPAVIARATAYVYVSSESFGSSVGQISGYAVAMDGSVSPVPGSPYSETQIQDLGIAGATLYSIEIDSNIHTYSIAANGSLTAGSIFDVAAFPYGTSSGEPGFLSFDNAGQSIYPLYGNNDVYQSFSIESGGSLNFLGYTYGATAESDTRLSFTSNNLYAYDSSSFRGDGNIVGYERSASGLLTNSNDGFVPLQLPGVGLPYGAAVWGNSYVVVAEAPAEYVQLTGPYQLVVYTINSSDGSLSTTTPVASSVLANVGYVSDYRFNPAQDTLAVAGTSAITLFSFNNGVLSQTSTFPIAGGVNELRWDNAGHLFAVGGPYGQPGYLYVFNVANGVATPAPGSPLAEPSYGFLAVQALP